METLTRIFVYGTLRKKERNFSFYLKDAVYIGDTYVDNMVMVSMGAFPAAIPAMPLVEGWQVKGEVYDVTDAELRAIDNLEGIDHRFYMRKTVQTKLGECIMYILHPRSFWTRFMRDSDPDIFVNGDFEDKELLSVEPKDLEEVFEDSYLVAAKLHEPYTPQTPPTPALPAPAPEVAAPIRPRLGPGVAPAPMRAA